MNGAAKGLLMMLFGVDDPIPAAVGSLITLGTEGENTGILGVDMYELPVLGAVALGAPVLGVPRLEPPPKLWAVAARPVRQPAPQATTAHIILHRDDFMDHSSVGPIGHGARHDGLSHLISSFRRRRWARNTKTGTIRRYLISVICAKPG
jgi:hypothetical protein